MSSYTAEELEHATGFDRRTIAYYVQEGLIPKVGRRGPRTRYPELIRDRLLFIRRVREAEASGEVSPVSLSQLRELFAGLPPEVVAQVASGQRALSEDLLSQASVSPRSPARRRAAIEARRSVREATRAGAASPAADGLAGSTRSFAPADRDSMAVRASKAALSPALAAKLGSAFEEGPEEYSVDFRREMTQSDDSEAEIGKTLAVLQEHALQHRKNASKTLDTWSRIEISPDIALSIRGVTDEDVGLLEKVASKLRRLISRHREQG